MCSDKLSEKFSEVNRNMQEIWNKIYNLIHYKRIDLLDAYKFYTDRSFPETPGCVRFYNDTYDLYLR